MFFNVTTRVFEINAAITIWVLLGFLTKPGNLTKNLFHEESCKKRISHPGKKLAFFLCIVLKTFLARALCHLYSLINETFFNGFTIFYIYFENKHTVNRVSKK